MTSRPMPTSRPIVRRTPFPAAGLLSIMLLGALAGAVTAGCSTSDGSPGGGGNGGAAGGGGAPSTHGPTLMAHGMPMTAADMSAAWAARPAYVDGNGAATSEAYAFALTRPDLLQYMPCYCGCVAMDHRSNLDCFLRPRQAGMGISFEEHASYCVVCVDTALMAKRMLAEGASFGAIRQAVDASFGDTGAPGTNTELPPA
ncbi:MAG TPA: PCYCGC motif-containing (lipo)protein [Candidatus Limnocylindrales bacterium]|nr:PCYCGC motif-containing (lipo)protein [Candidatus Limnocylindrales bacterium]